MDKRTLAILTVVILLLGWFWIRGHNYYPITNERATGDVILAFGDSLTYGTGAEKSESWPSLVAERCGCSIVNLGVPGETTAEAVRRIDGVLAAHDARMVIVLLGGNDMLRRLPQEQLFQNLRRIIGEIQASGAMVVLVGLNGFPLDSGYGDEYKLLARETGSVFVPNILGGIFSDPKLKSDQVHPNAEGYKVMADRIYKAIEPYL